MDDLAQSKFIDIRHLRFLIYTQDLILAVYFTARPEFEAVLMQGEPHARLCESGCVSKQGIRSGWVCGCYNGPLVVSLFLSLKRHVKRHLL